MESGNQNTPSKELSSHSEEDEGSHDSSEDRSSSTANSPTRTASSTFPSSGTLHKKQRLDTERENVSSILPPFYNLQPSDMNIPSSSSNISNIPSQTNFHNTQQDNLSPININLTTRQEVPSSEQLSSMNAPLAPKTSQRQLNVVGEDFRGQPSSLLDQRQALHATQIASPFGISFQHYPPSIVNVAPLSNLSLPYPLPSFPPPQTQTATYYSPTPQYHYPMQYSMQQPVRSSTESMSAHPQQTSTNQKEYQVSNLDPKATSTSQNPLTSSTDQLTSTTTSAIANLSSSTPSSSSNVPPSASTIPLVAHPSSSREAAFQTAQAAETPQSLYLQSPYSSQNRPPSTQPPSHVRSTMEEPYYNWPPQLPPVSIARPGMYSHITYSGMPVYSPYVSQMTYDTSGMTMAQGLPGISVWPAPSPQGVAPTVAATTPSNTNFTSQRPASTWQAPYSPHKRAAVEGRAVNLLPTQQHRFELQMQPFSNQRKSYKSEKRYILPNPLTISLKKKKASDNNNNANTTSESPDDVVSGFVTVDLVDGLGNPIPNKEDIFASIDGTFSQTLSAEGVAQFSLKVLANSGPDKYRLLFRVVYTTRDGITYEEQIPSQAFSVKSNKALKAKMAQEAQRENQAQILELSVNHGRPHKPVTVWIKAKGINNPTVLFGDRQATIRDWEEDLIRCTVPSRIDITQNTTVEVTASNATPDGTSPVEGRLQYTYKLKKNRPNPPSPKNQNPLPSGPPL